MDEFVDFYENYYWYEKSNKKSIEIEGFKKVSINATEAEVERVIERIKKRFRRAL